MSRWRRSTASRAGAAPSSASTAVPIPPPVSTSDPRPVAAWTSTSMVTSRAATALASKLASWWTMTSGGVIAGRAAPGGRPPCGPIPSSRGRDQDVPERGEDLRVYVVGVEPPQLLLEQLRGLPAVQRHPALGLPGTAQVRDPPVRPGDHDVPLGGGEADLGDARPGGGLGGHRGAQSERQPGREQVGG